jgi:hypothetical protein
MPFFPDHLASSLMLIEPPFITVRLAVIAIAMSSPLLLLDTLGALSWHVELFLKFLNFATEVGPPRCYVGLGQRIWKTWS